MTRCNSDPSACMAPGQQNKSHAVSEPYRSRVAKAMACAVRVPSRRRWRNRLAFWKLWPRSSCDVGSQLWRGALTYSSVGRGIRYTLGRKTAQPVMALGGTRTSVPPQPVRSERPPSGRHSMARTATRSRWHPRPNRCAHPPRTRAPRGCTGQARWTRARDPPPPGWAWRSRW